METRSLVSDSESMTHPYPTTEAVAGKDWVARNEFEAAEALAGLAHSAAQGSGTSSGRTQIKRPRQTVKNGLQPGDSGKKPEFLVGKCSVSPEAEKEARRIRRVLANRESARQTIRRRQAAYEELTTKAGRLALENETLKRDMELALKEYDSLKIINESLKGKMARTMKTQVEKSQVDSNSTNGEISTPPITGPLIFYNQSQFTPYILPAIIQSSDLMRLPDESQNPIFVPSKAPMLAITKPDSYCEQANCPIRTPAGTPLYILPCTWLFPIPGSTNDYHPRSTFDLNCEPTPLNSVRPTSVVKHDVLRKSDNLASVQAFPSSSIHTANAFQEAKKDLNASLGKKLADTSAAAVARKRRKELTKLKRQNYC